MKELTFSALTMHSANPERLALFYRDVVGLPLHVHEHGSLGPHFEATVGGVHLAVWKAAPRVGGPFVPVFRVESLELASQKLSAGGVQALHKPLDLGEAKRVTTFSDPDGNAFRLIEIVGG